MKSRILDYFDFERSNILLEGFNKATGFVTAIVDLDGNILSKSGLKTQDKLPLIWYNKCKEKRENGRKSLHLE